MHRAVFLDRDGVVNRPIIRNNKPFPPRNTAEVEILPGVLEGLKLLEAHGWYLIIVTNQPDIARGTASRADVEEINQHLSRMLPIKAVYVCYHDDAENCQCRKPKPGLLLNAARDYEIDLAASFMIGDRWKDIEAGRAAGCRSIFIDYKYDERQPDTYTYLARSLRDAAEKILLIGEPSC
jgi:D-glycero-D-manno-heptose 1,7-bisphosphate phosphatase